MTGRKCSKCRQTKAQEEFCKDKNKPDGLDTWCRSCKRESNRKSYKLNKEKYTERNKLWREANREESARKKRKKRDDDPAPELLYSAKYRALARGLEFNLTREDIVIPERCPVLGTKISRTNTSQSRSSPSLDRIDSSKGYTKDNVQVISWQANTMKSNASKEELIAFAKWVLDFYKEEY